jgi:glucose-1-phosphate cytidylyltransferase
MVEIGGRPILWHIMKTYSHYGYNDFIILLGYMGYFIKEYFANYFLHQSDVTFDLQKNEMTVHQSASEDWKVTLVDTGGETLTAGRIKRVEKFIDTDSFMLTYGDGVANIDVDKLVTCHEGHDGIVTMTSIKPESRYGVLKADVSGRVDAFLEKPQDTDTWINGGFFVCDRSVLDYLPAGPEGDALMFERKPLEQIAGEGKLYTYRHDGYWQCMDTLRDKETLNMLWETGTPPWKVWK